MGWDVCTAPSSFPLLRKVAQLFSVLPWAVLGRLSVTCPVQEPLAALSGSCAARPGPCCIPMANPPSLAKALSLLSTVFLIPPSFLTGTGAEGSVPEQGLDGLALPAVPGAEEPWG